MLYTHHELPRNLNQNCVSCKCHVIMTSFQRYTASHNFNIVLMGVHFDPIRMVWMMASIEKRKKFIESSGM